MSPICYRVLGAHPYVGHMLETYTNYTIKVIAPSVLIEVMLKVENTYLIQKVMKCAAKQTICLLMK